MVLLPFPFTDFSAVKVRPAVIVTDQPAGSDLIVAYVSSVLPAGSPAEGHVLIGPDHAEFRLTGLRQASVIRADKLMTVARSRVHRRLGHLGPSLLAALDTTLRETLGL